MPLTRTQKETLVQEFHLKADQAKVAIFVNFRGVSVAKMNELRTSLRRAGVDFKVTKKTLLKRVLGGLGFAGEMPTLEGELATAFSYEESPEAARIIRDFAKENPGMTILGGVFGGGYMLADGAIRLASVPPREVLLAQLVGLLQSPSRGLVGVLSGPLRNVVGVMKELAQISEP